MALTVANKWESMINDYKYINDRIVGANVKGKGRDTTTVAAYTPKAGRHDDSTSQFKTLLTSVIRLISQ